MVMDNHVERVCNDIATSALLYEHLSIHEHLSEVRENTILNELHRSLSFDIALETISQEFIECMEDELYAIHQVCVL